MLPEEKKTTLDPTVPKACPRCVHSNSALSRFCMVCGMALDLKAAVEDTGAQCKSRHFHCGDPARTDEANARHGC